MIGRRASSIIVIAGLAACASAQQELTPPIPANVTPVATPPVITLPPPPGPSVLKTPTVTAEQAAQIALVHQPQIAIAKGNLQAAHGATLVQTQSLLPNVSLGAEYGAAFALNPNGTNQVSFSLTSRVGGIFSTSVSATQLIFDFNRTLDQIRQYKALEHASGFELTNTQSTTVLNVKTDYYTYVMDLQEIDVAKANVKDRQDQFALADARLKSGLGTPADVVTAQTGLSQAILALSQAQTTASTAQTALLLAMGVDARTPIAASPSSEPPLTTDDVNSLVDVALKQRPDLKEEEENLRAAGYAVSVARKLNLPSFSLVGGIGTGGVSDPFNSAATTIGITLSWQPFNFVGHRGSVEQAEGNRAAAEAQLNLQAQTVVSDVSNAYLGVRSAQQRIGIASSEVANAEEGVRLAIGQYKAGLTIFTTVSDAEAQLAQARSDQVTANASLQLSLSAMQHALGQVL